MPVELRQSKRQYPSAPKFVELIELRCGFQFADRALVVAGEETSSSEQHSSAPVAGRSGERVELLRPHVLAVGEGLSNELIQLRGVQPACLRPFVMFSGLRQLTARKCKVAERRLSRTFA